MSNVVIQVEELAKQYRLGVIGHGTLYKDLQSWWARFRGKDDPNQMVIQRSGAKGDRFWALEDINFEVSSGEVLGVIGRNGAGKSTLLKILSRVTLPTKGEARIKGRLASLLEVGTGFHPELTGRENVYLNGAILGMSKEEVRAKFDEIVDFSGVEQFIDTPVKRYSSGMYVRLAFAVAAHLEPEILVVDEVLAVGDVQFQKKCLGKMEDVARSGRTVLFVSHNMGAVGDLCSRAILLEEGKLVHDGPTEETVAKYLNHNLLEGAIAGKDEIAERMEGVIQRENPFIRFDQIGLHDQAGLPRQSFHSDEDIVVKLDFECFQPVSNLLAVVKIVDESGHPILASQSWDNEQATDATRELEPGSYSVSCTLPGNMFNGRRYFLSVELLYPKTEHIVINKILEFEVSFKGYNNFYGGGGKAYIRPALSWEMEKNMKVVSCGL